MEKFSSRGAAGKTSVVVGVVLLVVLVGGGLLMWGAARGWKAFVSSGMVSDLSEYQATINASSLEPRAKGRLLQQIDIVRERAREKPIGFWRWIGYTESFRAVLDDKVITADEAAILERELSRLEREFE